MTSFSLVDLSWLRINCHFCSLDTRRKFLHGAAHSATGTVHTYLCLEAFRVECLRKIHLCFVAAMLRLPKAHFQRYRSEGEGCFLFGFENYLLLYPNFFSKNFECWISHTGKEWGSHKDPPTQYFLGKTSPQASGHNIAGFLKLNHIIVPLLAVHIPSHGISNAIPSIEMMSWSWNRPLGNNSTLLFGCDDVTFVGFVQI